MPSGHQRRPGRTATGVVIQLRESNAASREAIQVWSLDLAVETADIRIPEVVRQYQQDVALLTRLRRQTRAEEGKEFAS